MKSHNKFLASAVAVAIGTLASSAFAGNMSTTTRYIATEVFGPTLGATAALTPAATSYAVSSAGGVTVANLQSTTVYLRLSGTHKFDDAKVAPADFSTLGTLTKAAAIVVSADKRTVALTYDNTTGAAVNLPINTTIIWTPQAGSVVATTAELNTAGGNITITGSLDGNLASPASAAAATLPSSQDPVAAPVTLVASTQAITGVAKSSATFTKVEDKLIDLGALTGPATAFTLGTTSNTPASTALVNLGSVTFTNNASFTVTNVAGVAYALPAAASAVPAFPSTDVTVTPDAGKSFQVGSKLGLYTDLTCATPATGVAAVSAALTATTAAAPVVLTTTNAPGTNVPVYVCLTANAVAPIAAITEVAPTISAVLKKGTTTDATNNIAATAAYALKLNGKSIDVTNYVPAAVTGWTQYIRVANTGGQTADVRAAVIDEATGVAGASAVVVTGLKAGAVKNLTAADIEAAVGAQAAGARPRIRVTAPTTGLTVQNMLFTPNGSFTNNSSEYAK